MRKLSDAKIIIRNASLMDAAAIAQLNQHVYGEHSFQQEHIRGHINTFPEGQFVAEFQGKIVGYCATFIIGDTALKSHTWREITGHGYASRHDENGIYLYGMEVCVDPEYRSLRIGQRLYSVRKKLCQSLKLKGIIFGGRLPGFAKRRKKVQTIEQYVELVKSKKLRDPVLTFQLANGFELIGILPDYLRHDKESAGYAAHLLWRNPLIADSRGTLALKNISRLPKTVRIASVQFQVRKVKSEEEFEQQLSYFIEVASDYKSDFVLFPEMLTVPLLSAQKEKLNPAQSIEWLTSYTDRFLEFMEKQAIRRNVNIIAGSHPTRRGDDIYNISYIFLRDGSVYSQAKIHPTPNERFWWNIKGGRRLDVIPTDCGPIGVLICYDAEFPELARHLADQGALFLFVPFCTDERQGYMRVRYCCQARAVENQMFVVMSGIVGNLPDVENMDIHYAQSGILTPCDFNFTRDGIATMADPNVEMVCFADLRPENLMLSRNDGTVRNMRDRRFDLYKVDWLGD
jgi:predicted amidohydrolase/GNAT superfamily N-acetyltransferase